MGDDVGKASEVTTEGKEVPPAPFSIPSTLDDLKQLESSIMTQMETMLAQFLAPKENPTPSADATPKVAPIAMPLFKFVPQGEKPLDEGAEGKGTSTPKDNGGEK